jgi:phage terminase small subunit
VAHLTEKQENFAIEYIMNGGNATAAYEECYDVGEGTSKASIWVNAHKVLHNDKVALRVHELRTMKISKKVLTVEERKQLLTEWILEGDRQSVEILNKMEGVYVEKQKVELTGKDGEPVEQKWTVEFKESPKDE